MSHLPISMATAALIIPAVQFSLPGWSLPLLIMIACVEAWLVAKTALMLWRWVRRFFG